ncbi:MAG: cellulase family glycosylhydrolase [Oscillospiraceae bacterium]|nr:cellulase family glycosylhydrolase [Oscillospiraceae bacterium]
MDQITVKGRRFVDALGRERIFHGINFPMGKTDPPTLEEGFFVKSRALGFNILRLGPCWSKIEPEFPGEYDEAYLKIMDGIFDMAERHGMYVFLDMHQDLWSDFGAGVGDGAPVWATRDGGYGYTKPKAIWAEGYFWGKGIFHAFDHFWANGLVYGKGLQEHYADLWAMLARRYGDHPAFFGFDFLNEPHPGSPGGKFFKLVVAGLVKELALLPCASYRQFAKDLEAKGIGPALDILTPELMRKVVGSAEHLSRKFDLEVYTPFIEKMTKAVRAVTPKGIIIMEHGYYSNAAIPFHGDAPAGETQCCYSPHGYDFFVDGPLYDHASDARVGCIFGEARRAQLRMNVPVLAGEWGATGTLDDKEKDYPWFRHIEFILGLFDSWGWSNTYWAYWHGLYEYDNFTAVLGRPYPVAIHGTFANFKVDPKAKTCTLWYTPAPDWESHPTEFFLPDGYENVDAGPGAKISMQGNLLQVITDTPKIVVKYK